MRQAGLHARAALGQPTGLMLWITLLPTSDEAGVGLRLRFGLFLMPARLTANVRHNIAAPKRALAGASQSCFEQDSGFANRPYILRAGIFVC